MALVEEFIESMLEHAAPQYYDPVKAHEYYLRTRELSGRQSGLKTQTQKEAFAFSKVQIEAAKQKELDAAAATRQASMDKIRKTAQLRRDEIRNKLNALLDTLTKSTTAQSKAATDQIKALPPIPKGLSKAEAAKAHAARSAQIAKIRGDVSNTRAAAGLQKKGARDSSHAEVAQVQTQMKATLDSARTSYETLKKSLKAKYETTTQKEFEAIKQNV